MSQELGIALICSDEVCVFIHQIKDCCVCILITSVYRFNRYLAQADHVSELVFFQLEISVCVKFIVLI